MKFVYGSILVLIASTPAFAAPAPEVSASGGIAAAVLSVGVAAWLIERRNRRS